MRRKGKKYKYRRSKEAGRGVIPNRVDIDQRPLIVDEKRRVGDYELDTIVGAHHKGAILSIVKKRTKLTKLMLISTGTADNISRAIVQSLWPIKQFVHTLTSDNGKEFSGHQSVAKTLDAGFFFAKPYRACERGLNENTNGLVRQYFSKKTVCYNNRSRC